MSLFGHSYVFHKYLIIKDDPASSDKRRWRCENFSKPKYCGAFIKTLGDKVVQEPLKDHTCGEPDATRPYVLRVS